MAKAIPAELANRIRDEIVAAGVTKYGQLKAETRHLAEIIHPNEHIGGIVYGRYEHTSAMIVATNLRVLFLDHKVMFRKTDELSYDIISGVSVNRQDGYAGVTLHTRLGDYNIRFVNLTCAGIFVKYIETKRIEVGLNQFQDSNSKLTTKPKITKEKSVSSVSKPKQLNKAAMTFLNSHDLGVISTVGGQGNVHGAAVYYTTDNQGYIYLVTKEQTNKAQNIQGNPKVALTVFNSDSLQTLQISGLAHIESDPDIVDPIYKKVLHPRLAGAHVNMPPILSLPAGNFVVICIVPSEYQFTDYKNGILGEGYC